MSDSRNGTTSVSSTPMSSSLPLSSVAVLQVTAVRMELAALETKQDQKQAAQDALQGGNAEAPTPRKSVLFGAPQATEFKSTEPTTALTPMHQSHASACFPMHFDSDATLDARKITALTYLNPDWTEGDGGELPRRSAGHPKRGEPLRRTPSVLVLGCGVSVFELLRDHA